MLDASAYLTQKYSADTMLLMPKNYTKGMSKLIQELYVEKLVTSHFCGLNDSLQYIEILTMQRPSNRILNHFGMRITFLQKMVVFKKSTTWLV